MKADFWLERWEMNQLGFHQAETNAHLAAHWPALEIDPASPVFLPLCGKTLDMHWLREQGHLVQGVELSQIACRDFFAEAGIESEVRKEGAFDVHTADGYRLLCGDFFDLEPRQLEDVTGVFDRGSLVALPPEMRRRYADHLTRLLTEGTKILLLAVEYDQTKMSGPPHSVTGDEIEALFGDAFAIDARYRSPLSPAPPHFAARGLDLFRETVWRLERRG